MEENKNLFKPEPVKVTLGDTDYNLIYDLNAFCELEKIYGSIDVMLQMILGTDNSVDTSNVTYNGAQVNAEEIAIAGTPLPEFLSANIRDEKREMKHADTLNILWGGTLHDSAIYNEHDEIIGYKVSKQKIGSMVTLQNLKQINVAIVTAIIRDLVPRQVEKAQEEIKNEEAPKPLLVVK